MKLIERLRNANLKLQSNECYFLKREVCFLDRILSEDGLKSDPKPIEAVKSFSTPKYVKKQQKNGFKILKEKLCKSPVLIFSDFDNPIILTTDASYFAIAEILSQGVIGRDKPCAYVSRLLNSAETRYSTYKKETLTIIFSVQHFRPYLYGRQFVILTDHKPLC